MTAKNTPIQRAMAAIGGQSELSRLLGTTRQTVSSWNRRGVPVGRCIEIEAATKGVLHRKLLRPTDWRKHWPELAAQKPSRQSGVSAGEGGV